MAEKLRKPDGNEHRKRVKRTFIKGGFESFEPHNALEMLLFYSVPQSDTKPLASELIARFGGFDKVLEADYESLLEVDGVGEHTAVFIKLLLESYRYYEREKRRPGFNAASASVAVSYAKSLFAGMSREAAYLMCFDSGLDLLACAKLSEGTVDAAAVTARRVIELATLHRASAVILAHNHPGGGAAPSSDDLRATANVMKALDAIDIALVDHIIVSAKDAFSFAGTGTLQTLRNELTEKDGF